MSNTSNALKYGWAASGRTFIIKVPDCWFHDAEPLSACSCGQSVQMARRAWSSEVSVPVNPDIVTRVPGIISTLLSRISHILFDASRRGLLWLMLMMRKDGTCMSKGSIPLGTPIRSTPGLVISCHSPAVAKTPSCLTTPDLMLTAGEGWAMLPFSSATTMLLPANLEVQSKVKDPFSEFQFAELLIASSEETTGRTGSMSWVVPNRWFIVIVLPA